MSSENWREEYRRRNARGAKIFGALAVLLLAMGIWASYNDVLPFGVNLVLASEGFGGAICCFFGMIVSLIFMSTDNC